MSLVALLLQEPGLFDCLQEGSAILPRGDHSIQLIRDFHQLNQLNGLNWRVNAREANLADALTGSNERNGLQIAHILPHATGKEPALWLFARVVGLAPWAPQTAVKRHKEGLWNLVPLPKSFHTAMDCGYAEAILRLSRADLIELILKLEACLADQEKEPNMAPEPQAGKWKWDVAELQTSRLPYNEWSLFRYLPMWIPSRSSVCDQTQTYVFKSEKGERGDLLTRAVYREDQQDEEVPASLPVQYVTRSRTGWQPGDRENGEMLAVRLPISPFTITAANKMAFARRNHDRPDDLLRTSLGVNAEVLSADRSDPHGRLEDYLLALLCSQTPSEFRSFERPSDLLPEPIPVLVGDLCNIPRAWATDIVGVDPRRIRGDTQDSDSSEDSVRSRWTTLLRSWRIGRRNKFTADISGFFMVPPEPLPADTLRDMEDELGCFRAAADEAGYLHALDEPFSSLCGKIESDMMFLLAAQVDRQGARVLLLSAEATLLGLSSYRRLWHAMQGTVQAHA
ncbi:unnamed protein product [Sympodiomycopsis kandeliae]